MFTERNVKETSCSLCFITCGLRNPNLLNLKTLLFFPPFFGGGGIEKCFENRFSLKKTSVGENRIGFVVVSD